MRPTLLTFILVALIANLATGQTMQAVIENLITHQLIEEDNKKDAELILTRQDDTSKTTILQALAYVEMVKLVGREHMSEDFASVASYLKMPLTEPTRQQQDSTNRDLSGYLTKISSAGLITDSLYLEWKKIGIVNHLTKGQISAAEKKTLAGNNENLNDALLNFPNVIHWFDTELGNLNDPYAELLKEFFKISHGVFKPINISDNFSKPIKNKVTVKFTLNSKNYSKDFKIQDDWIDADFFDFVKQVVTENKLAGQFYELYEGGQGANIIFLTPKQHQYLKTNKFMVFAEDYKREDE